MNECELEDIILASLNAKQRQAVTSPCSGILQIVAGPGTGKTKVVVSRVAFLLLHEGIQPEHVIVTTFTKKAANEMMERLREIFEGTDIPVGKLLIGTFHSICYKIIQRYGRLIGLEGMSIADENDSQHILKSTLEKRISAEQWEAFDLLPSSATARFKARQGSKDKYKNYDKKKIKREISKAKAAALFPEDYGSSKDASLFLSPIYRAYQDELLANKVLDFDDCLLYCNRIISRFPVLQFVEHTLVDEFQDTNEIQLQLMYNFAKGDPTEPKKQSNITIVGDPDQSIYAFRDAQAVNFEKMRDFFQKGQGRSCEIITLEENYRSTSGILDVSEKVMRQQSGRVVKNLVSQHKNSIKPLLATLSSNEEEGKWIALQVEFLAGLPQEIFSFSDMAILVRSAFQTRAIETELVKSNIPYFILRGKAFWDRKEVVAILNYLRCVANKNNKLALMRCVNFPKRGLGSKTLTELETLIEAERVKNPGQTALEVLKQIACARIKSSFGSKIRSNLKSFISVLEEANHILISHFESDNLKQADGLAQAFEWLYQKSGIAAEFENTKDIDLNVGEVKSQLLAFEPPQEMTFPDYEGEFEAPIEEITGPIYVRKFLESISLYETNPGEKDNNIPKVSISTIHGSKGLEWPVVFVPGVSEGLLPASFAINESIPETINEERRCFYVATSRAQALLFISAYADINGGNSWHRNIDTPSRFLKSVREHCDPSLNFKDTKSLNALYEIRGRKLIDTSFDANAYCNRYNEKMRKYKKQGRAYAEFKIGEFATAADLDTESPEINRVAGKYDKSYKQPVIEKTSFPINLPRIPGLTKKAPPYIPNRGIATKTIKVSEDVPEIISLGADIPVSRVKRAPSYIPVRSTSKKRLGLK